MRRYCLLGSRGVQWRPYGQPVNYRGEADTSVSPIFIAAGKGLKQAFTTERVIRQTDLVPTMCVLGNVRMPDKCEGAPIYQILAEGLEV